MESDRLSDMSKCPTLRSYVYTDMASELYASAKNESPAPFEKSGNPLHDSGIVYKESRLHGIRVEQLTVASKEASEVIGKSIGTYYTLHTGSAALHTPQMRDAAHKALLDVMTQAVRHLCPQFRVPSETSEDTVHIPQTTVASPGEEAILRRPMSAEWDQEGHLYAVPPAALRDGEAAADGIVAEGDTPTGTTAITDIPPIPLSDDEAEHRPMTVLAVGLGNPSLTTDALGPMCVGTLQVTRHLGDTVLPGFDRPLSDSVHRLCAITPLVVGQTGIETLELVRGAVDAVSPDLVILIDALAASELGTLMRTVQISTTGVHPGGGIGNRRMPLDKETLGVPVITVGVPTVIAASTLICRALEGVGLLPQDDTDDDVLRTSLHRVLADADTGYVSPKDVDASVSAYAQLIGDVLNTLTMGRALAAALTPMC